VRLTRESVFVKIDRSSQVVLGPVTPSTVRGVHLLPLPYVDVCAIREAEVLQGGAKHCHLTFFI